jgi:hypothetical protein
MDCGQCKQWCITHLAPHWASPLPFDTAWWLPTCLSTYWSWNIHLVHVCMIVLAIRVHNSVQLCKRSSVVLWHPILTLDHCWMCALSCRGECKRSSGRRGSLGTGLYLMGMLTRGYPLPCPVHTEHQWDLLIWVETIAFGLLSKLSSPKIHKGPRVSVSSVDIACWQHFVCALFPLLPVLLCSRSFESFFVVYMV